MLRLSESNDMVVGVQVLACRKRGCVGPMDAPTSAYSHFKFNVQQLSE